ncbi:hypothetical protein HC251_01640 [Iamia sp. SCSIO 61187]|uniref:hypothetical protein n=1 Tax=Iamia sp. SCSIO 61187 TaxID=2722752 RepID=UPI001C62D78B|nr:hypothetical protein [Iamia sp. SCSIO 61187]QYG91265.1 hypothetical protein HC251_01640 [Iamia sp. SCSIO 61187]
MSTTPTSIPTTPAPATLTEAEIADLAEAVAVDGPAAHERGLRRLAAAVAARVRATPRTETAIEVMLDRTAAPVLRSRAFGLASAALMADPAAGTATVDVRDRAA